MFLDRPGGERIVLLALEGQSNRVRSDVLSLLPGFQNRFYTWNEGAGEIKQDRLNGVGEVGGNEEEEVNCTEFQLPRQIR